MGLKYKPVERKVRPVPTTMPQDAIPKRRFPENPLDSLKPLTPHPPPISKFGSKLMRERWGELKVDRDFLTEEELKLAFEVVVTNEEAIAWEDAERGTFRNFAKIILNRLQFRRWSMSPGRKANPYSARTSTASNSIYQEEDRKRSVRTIKFILQIALVLCAEKGWKFPDCSQFTTLERSNSQGCRTPTKHRAVCGALCGTRYIFNGRSIRGI
jgi:hypothetical protein